MHDVKIQNLMQICVKNIAGKSHPDPIWKDKALGFFERGHLNKN